MEKYSFILSGSKIATIAGKKRKVMIAPKEEYLKVNTTTDHSKIADMATIGE